MFLLALPGPTQDDLIYLASDVPPWYLLLAAIFLLLLAGLQAFLRWCDLTGVGTPYHAEGPIPGETEDVHDKVTKAKTVKPDATDTPTT